MKHKKLSISIVSAFIAALGLTACSSVTASPDRAIVTIKGYDGNNISINADDIYDKFKESEDGISSFYQAILEVLIRDHFENDASMKDKYDSFMQSAKNDVTSDQQKARDNAETNNSSYDDEWKAILDAAGVEDEEGLLQHHLYKYEKAEYQDTYFEKEKANLTHEYIGYDAEGNEPAADARKANSMYPYHIRHILVKTSASATDYVTGEITAAEAQKLSTVYKALVEGRNSFGQTAKLLSDDGSAASFGDAGIMTTATSFVNEFKLGIYAYDMIYGNNVTGTKALKDANTGLGLAGSYNESTTKVADKLNEIGLAEVPFGVFEFLGEEYDTETADNGLKVNDGLAKSFPRNVIWNNYLNLHNVFVITDEVVPGLTTATVTEAAAGKTGFRSVPGLNLGSKKVLTDEDGRVIVGVRSEFGIHFMIMERTPFETTGTITGYEAGNYTTDSTSITDYYTTLKPGDNGYPKTEAGKDKVTYVNFMQSEASTYADRAKTVKDEIKGFDKMYDYRMFEELVAKDTIKINDEVIEAKIEQYIENKRSYNMWNTEKQLNDAWNTYLDKILLQNEIRNSTYQENGVEKSRLVKVTCGISFKDHAADDPNWVKGGLCYYEA